MKEIQRVGYRLAILRVQSDSHAEGLLSRGTNRSVIGVTVYSVSLECEALGSELHGQHLIPSPPRPATSGDVARVCLPPRPLPRESVLAPVKPCSLSLPEAASPELVPQTEPRSLIWETAGVGACEPGVEVGSSGRWERAVTMLSAPVASKQGPTCQWP